MQHEEQELRGVITSPDDRRAKAAGTGRRTFVLTCAQNNTKLHTRFWDALRKYCEWAEAELHVSRFVYNKSGLSAGDSKEGTVKTSDHDQVWYDPRIEPYVSDQSLELAPGLIWCGELNILPTRVTPLSTLRSYTRAASGIVPHVKMHMDSIPTMKHDPAKMMYTTGTVTQRNYIQRAAGQIAEFHHVFGALVVEVDDSGQWWVRQLNADANGGFHDLDMYFDGAYVASSGHVWAITHGDIHIGKNDADLLNTVFGDGGIVDQLQPREQFFHDILDFTPRNHHNRKDPHFLWSAAAATPVEEEFAAAAVLLAIAHRKWSQRFVVTSNHDQAIEGWLKDTDAFADPANVRFWLAMNTYVFDELAARRTPRPFAKALTDACRKESSLPPPVILHEDSSHKILSSIEAALHGHLGPNGARGSPKNLRTAGKANTGHTHSAGIIDGVYTAGVYGKLDMGYNKGLSSWSNSFIVTYANAKRAILTIKNGKAWRDQE